MTNTSEVTAKFLGAEYWNSSPNANPTFKLHTSEGVLSTKVDAAIGYDIDNHSGSPKFSPESWVGKDVVFTVEGSRVIGWRLA